MSSNDPIDRLFDSLDDGWGLALAAVVLVVLLGLFTGFGGVLAILWFLLSIGVTVFVIYLFYRLVLGVERLASAHEQLVAAELHDGGEIEVSPKTAESDAGDGDVDVSTDADGTSDGADTTDTSDDTTDTSDDTTDTSDDGDADDDEER